LLDAAIAIEAEGVAQAPADPLRGRLDAQAASAASGARAAAA
jgi:hypothetical protein